MSTLFQQVTKYTDIMVIFVIVSKNFNSGEHENYKSDKTFNTERLVTGRVS